MWFVCPACTEHTCNQHRTNKFFSPPRPLDFATLFPFSGQTAQTLLAAGFIDGFINVYDPRNRDKTRAYFGWLKLVHDTPQQHFHHQRGGFNRRDKDSKQRKFTAVYWSKADASKVYYADERLVLSCFWLWTWTFVLTVSFMGHSLPHGFFYPPFHDLAFAALRSYFRRKL